MESIRQEVARVLWDVCNLTMPDWSRAVIDVAQAHGLTVGELQTIMELQFGPPLRVLDLAERTGLSKAATSQMVDRLVRQRLVLREESQEDRREKQVSLSPEGRGVMDQFDARLVAMMADSLSSLQPETEARLLAALLDAKEELRATKS